MFDLSDTPLAPFLPGLNRSGIMFMITGSLACVVYGEPRLTHDVDVVADLSASDVPTVRDAFPAAEFYVPPQEVLIEEVLRSSRGHFNLIHHQTGYKADIYLRGRDPLHASRKFATVVQFPCPAAY